MERWYFFFARKYIFSLGGKWKEMIFIKKRVEVWYFLYICVGVTGVTLPSWQKKQRCREKNAPKGDISGITEKDDIHSRFVLDWSYFCWNTTFIYTLERAQEVVTGDVLQEKVFLKFTGKDLCQSLFFNKATDLRPATLLKKKLCRRCFPVNFAKFLRTLFLENTSRRLLLEFQLFSVLLWRP